MNFQVIIPAVNPDLTKALFQSICSNTLLPSFVIILDNTPKRNLMAQTDKFQIVIKRMLGRKRWGTNECWKEGIKLLTKCDAVSFLNDDIILGHWYFQRIKETFEINGNCAVACPSTTEDINGLRRGRVRYEIMPHREGWAFTIKKGILSSIPEIPDQLKVFFGDDWFNWSTSEMNLVWCKDLGNTIYHVGGATLRKMNKSKRVQTREEERKIFTKITGITFSSG